MCRKANALVSVKWNIHVANRSQETNLRFSSIFYIIIDFGMLLLYIGLLGINGAGKTTTFKMLTGDLTVSGGDAFVVNYSVRKDLKRVHENLGYCPQFDAIIEELTGRETIWMYARLRGISESLIDGLADRLAKRLLFSQHIDKYVGAYR